MAQSLIETLRERDDALLEEMNKHFVGLAVSLLRDDWNPVASR